MTSTKKDPVLVVLQLAGGNDELNTVIPYHNPKDFDNRPNVRIPEHQVLPTNVQIGIAPHTGQPTRMYDDGQMPVIHGHR